VHCVIQVLEERVGVVVDAGQGRAGTRVTDSVQIDNITA